MESRHFNPRHLGELLKHMDKQNEVFMEVYRSMLHQLQKLQVEEEMLMQKMYEVMSAYSLTKKNDGNTSASYSSEAELSNKEDNEENGEQ